MFFLFLGILLTLIYIVYMWQKYMVYLGFALYNTVMIVIICISVYMYYTYKYSDLNVGFHFSLT